MLIYQLRIKIIYLFIICAILGLKANVNSDSLLRQLSTPISEIERVEILNELAFLNLKNNNIQVAEQYAIEALNLAKKIDYHKGIADAKVRFGILAQIEGKHNDAINFFESALALRKLYDTKKAVASILNQIGSFYFYQNNFDEAVKNYKQGLGFLSKQNKNRLRGKILHNLGELYSKIDDFELAATYLDSSMQIWIQLEDNRALVSTLQRLGHLYKELDNFTEALKSLKQSLHIAELNNFTKEQAKANLFLGNLYYDYETGQNNLAFKFYSAAEKLKSNLEKNNQAILYKSLGNIFRDQNKINQALEHYNASEVILKKIDVEDANWELAYLYFEIGNIYKKLKQYPKAKKYYLDCLTYFGEGYNPYDKAEAFLNLSEVYEQLGENKLSAQFYQKYIKLKDNIYSNRINAVNLQHNLQKAQKEKAELEAKYQKIKAENLEKAKINQRNNFLIALLLAGVLILTTMLALYRNRQKRQVAEYHEEQALLKADKAHLETQQAHLETNKAYMEIDNLLQNQELVIAQARLDEKDATQKQIGQDLHDSIGALLSTVKLYFADIFDRLDNLTVETSKKQEKTLELLDEATKEVRRIAHNMQSGMLAKFGLAEAVKELGNTINNSGQLAVKVYAYGFKEQKANNTDFKLYKIIQELVGNVLKHAKAKQLTISLTKQEGNLNIIVEDDGVGFDTSKIGEKDGIGLKNIAFRVTQLDGICHFDSVKDRGTNVIIDIPLRKEV